MSYARPLQLRIDWTVDPEAAASAQYTAALEREHELEQELQQARQARVDAFDAWRSVRYGGAR